MPNIFESTNNIAIGIVAGLHASGECHEKILIRHFDVFDIDGFADDRDCCLHLALQCADVRVVASHALVFGADCNIHIIMHIGRHRTDAVRGHCL